MLTAWRVVVSPELGPVSSAIYVSCAVVIIDLTHRAVLNMHELAVTSGFAAAYRLGAEYPFHGDEDCERLFRMYLAASHGVRMVSERIFSSSQLYFADANSEEGG